MEQEQVLLKRRLDALFRKEFLRGWVVMSIGSELLQRVRALLMEESRCLFVCAFPMESRSLSVEGCMVGVDVVVQDVVVAGVLIKVVRVVLPAGWLTLHG